MSGELLGGRISAWWLIPLVCWALALVVAAAVDAVTQRVPGTLVRVSSAATVLADAGVALATASLGALWLTAVAALASFAIFGLCWRFAGLGFGDVRLAVLGGLGLGHARLAGVLAGCAVLALIVIIQSVLTLLRTEDPAREIPFGPAIAVGYLVAALI